MVEPPSKPLLQTLLELKLCTPADLKRCRRWVRRLARDLPAFDSIWIDALLQARRITPFQARVLDSPHPQRLAVGPCVLIEQLGQGRSCVTYLARRREGRELCVLKLIEPRPESAAAALENLGALAARSQKVAHPCIVAPHACLRHGSRIVAVSRYVPGPHLGELLIRRGRFPGAVVWAIARQLIDGLAALEERGGVHGDIRLANVRLTSAGTVALVDAGISSAVSPELTIHAGLPPDRYDGVAPELIGTGRCADSRSDLYALGCLLWHLLAGRPPFPTGDPLAKLVAHRLREVDDIRQIAPDTPRELADVVLRLTSADPAQRPSSFREIRERLGATRRSGRRRLAQFRAMFQTAARRVPAPARANSSSKWPALVAALVFLAGATVSLLDQGTRNYAANIVSSASHQVREGRLEWLTGRSAETGEASETDGRNRLLPLPPPDAQGVISLNSDGPYLWKRIDAVGPLTVRGLDGMQPVILVGNEPCRVVAEGVTIVNVRFRIANSERHPPAILAVEAQNLTLRNCRFATGLQESASPHGGAVAVEWTALDPRDRSGGRISLQDVIFEQGDALACSSVPRRLESDNCLKLGPGAFLTLRDAPAAGEQLAMELQNLTLRRATALLRCRWAETADSRGRILVEASDCVFDLSGQSASLFLFSSARPPLGWDRSVEMRGAASLARPDVVVAAWGNTADGAMEPLDTADLLLDGISAAAFEFAGPFSGTPADAAIRSFQAPSRSPRPPGIDAARLPDERGWTK